MTDFALFTIVLEHIELYDKLMSALNDGGFTGGVTITSQSMESSLATREDSHIIAALRAFMTADKVESRTILMPMKKEKTAKAAEIVRKVCAGGKTPGYMMFAQPLDFIECGAVTEK